MKWFEAPELAREVQKIVDRLNLEHLQHGRIFCYRTRGSKSRAIARIWAFPKIFQQVLQIEPAYVIEVISERFDKLSSDKKIRVLIHELLHIPKNFSGSLLPHRYGGKKIDREVEKLFEKL